MQFASKMRRAAGVVHVVAMLVLVTGLCASPATANSGALLAGLWLVEGLDPDGSDYEGTVTLNMDGNSISYAADIGGDHYTGTGLWNEATGALAVDFVKQSSGATGLSLFVLDEGMLKGHWVYSDAPQEIGMETWRRPGS